MTLSFKLTELLKKKCGRDISTPSGVETLALDIESKTDEHIGVNTLKRLLGIINDERMPRTSTLDIIARYLGYGNWSTLQQLDSGSNSDFGPMDNTIQTSQLPVGQKIVITYHPDRTVTVQHHGNGHFAVLSSVNSKLHVGDELQISHLVKSFPLLVSRVIRDGKDLGAFTAGKAQGIHFSLLT
ncbi:MAG: hypothetical protein J5529_06855 [Prevotella sp.]|nr:hypothetical protein [Prevotella sp.]